MALNAPHALVLDWWRRLHSAVDFYFGARGLNRPRNYIEILANDPRIGPDLAAEVDSLRIQRNQIAHERGKLVSTEEAAAFAERSLALIGTFIRFPPHPQGGPNGVTGSFNEPTTQS